MALQFSVAVRNARADTVESTIGATAILRIRSGAVPATCATADAGTILATLTLPSDWMSAASAGAKSLLGTWQETSADAAGTAAHFRIYDSAGTVCGLQGTVTATGGGGDMTLDNAVLALAQQVNVTAFTIAEGNA